MMRAKLEHLNVVQHDLVVALVKLNVAMPKDPRGFTPREIATQMSHGLSSNDKYDDTDVHSCLTTKKIRDFIVEEQDSVTGRLYLKPSAYARAQHRELYDHGHARGSDFPPPIDSAAE